jgi:hypothetical protein
MPEDCDSAGRSGQRLLDELRLPLRPGVRDREPGEPNFGGGSQLETTAARRSTRTGAETARREVAELPGATLDQLEGVQ